MYDSGTDSTHDEFTNLDNLSSTIAITLRCAAHTLSLCVTDANKILENQETELSKMHDQAIKKCNNIIESCK